MFLSFTSNERLDDSRSSMSVMMCDAPTNLNIDDIGALDVALSWDATDSADYYIGEIGPAGFTQGDGSFFNTAMTNTEVSGLMELTNYEVYLASKCMNGDTSDYFGPVAFTTDILNDVGITATFGPDADCGLGDEMVTVTLTNFGANPQSLIPFKYAVNGIDAGVSQPLDGFYTGVLSQDSSVTITFETTFDFSAGGLYNVVAWTELETDANFSNDSTSVDITSIPTVSDFPYIIDFETWDGGWTIDEELSENSTWDFGTPTTVDISGANSGVNCFVTNLTGNYNNNELSYIISPCFDFSAVSADPVINFAINYDTETNWDGAWLDVSYDSGDTWTKVGDIGSGVNWYTVDNTTQDLGPVWGGFSGGWINAEHPLTGVAGQSMVKLRFAFDSDGSVNGFDGVGIDDIIISPVFEDDLSTLSLSNSTNEECGTEMDFVTIEIRNAGVNSQSGFDVSYQVNETDVVTENVGSSFVLASGEVGSYTFTTPFNSNTLATDYNIIAWTSLSDELNFVNDSSTYVFSTATPDLLPIMEDFEDNVIPDGWVTSDFGIGNVHNNVSVVIYDNLYSFDQNYEATSPILGPINAGDSLTFDYRYTDWSAGTNATILTVNDSLKVEVSTDCGETYTTIDIINGDNHTPTNVMTNRMVDLDAFAGEFVKIRLTAIWGAGDYWIDLDNINIIGCPPDLGLDITTNYESSSGAGDGSIVLDPTQGSAPYNITWADPNAPNDISAGTYSVTITDAIGCFQEVEIELGVCPADLDLDISITNVSEAGATDGAVSISPSAGEGPYTYEWSNGASGSSVGDLPEGEYTITVTDINGCSDEVIVLVGIISNLTEIGDQFNKILLSPNPTTGYTALFLELKNSTKVQVQVLNVVGQVIYHIPAEQILSKTFELDLSEQAGGMYFVRILAGDQAEVIKLIKAE